MNQHIEEDPTGIVEARTRTQAPRAALTWLESQPTDAVKEYFEKRGTEPNYEETAALVKPYKYVNSAFRIYPLLLGDAGRTDKIRILSDARALHLDVREEYPGVGIDSDKHWFGSAMQVAFHVEGKPPQNCRAQWQEGYLPVAEWVWEQNGIRYHLEAFGTCLPGTTECLCAWLQVTMQRLHNQAAADFTVTFRGQSRLYALNQYLVHGDEEKQPLRAGFSPGWNFAFEAQQLSFSLPAGQEIGQARLVIINQPAQTGTLLEWPGIRPVQWAIDLEQASQESGLWLAECAEKEAWQRVKDAYCRGWDTWLAEYADVQIPEDVVNHAHKSVRIGSQIIATRNQMSYSAQNQYERLYTDESAQAAMGLAYWGHFADAGRYLSQLPFYYQRRVTTHDLGARLLWFCRYAALSGDQTFIACNQQRMHRWARQLADDIKPEPYGLATPGDYCGDLHRAVYSLSANSLAWRGIRDFAVLYGDKTLGALAEEYRDAIRCAAQATLDRTAEPPFLSMSLYGDDPTPDVLTGSTLGSYWCLMAPYALFADALGSDHEGTRAMLDSFKSRGGLCAGLVRCMLNEDYTSLTILREMGLDDLYGAKLCEVFARLDDPDQLVLALYGKLALGLTPETFIAGEGGSLAPSRLFGDESSDGRSFYLPPNSASQMMYAILLRHCLVFDFDTQGDGHTDMLRLAFSTPRQWLQEGKTIKVHNLPTAFGPVGYRIHSTIETRSALEATVQLPSRSQPSQVHLRLRPPQSPGRKLLTVSLNNTPFTNFDAVTETIDLSQFRGEVSIIANYSKAS